MLELEVNALSGNSLLPLSDSLRGRRIVDGLWLFEEAITTERRRVLHGAQILAQLYREAPFDPETIEEVLVAHLAESLFWT